MATPESVAADAATIVLQSQSPAALDGWQGRCCASVAAWARKRGYRYRRCGDDIFDRVPVRLRRRFARQRVVLSDLARLHWLRTVLEEGYDRAIWVDADVLIFRDFTPPAAGDHLGRECWIQLQGRRLRTYRKVHNAWLQFAAGSAFLPFYIDRAEALLQLADAPVVPQFIGPKLLTAWHNIVPFSVEERVGMLSPRCLDELLTDVHEPAPALARLVSAHRTALCAVNLCASLEGRCTDGVLHDADAYHRVVDGLLDGSLLRRLEGARAG
jgi:hypothetical protein